MLLEFVNDFFPLWLRLMDFLATYVLVLLCLNIFTHGFCKTTCIETERQALLKFKQDLKDSYNMLSVWTGKGDCCSWVGIVCDNVTGHVTEMHLNSSKAKFGGKLHSALLDLKYLSYLDLSNNEFEQTIIPTWFWNFTSQLHYLNISRNRFQGNIPDLITRSHDSVVLDFSFNNFNGSIPHISFNVTALDLSKNFMSGSVARFLCNKSNELMKLEVLNLSNNLFSGEIPDCWEKWPNLVAIKFCNNSFSGKIPSSIGTLTSLQSLHLRNNNLIGEVPSSLSNCTELLTIDFGANHLSGEIPAWMGERLRKLIIIILQTNRFHGAIPEKICALSSLQVLDLSLNNLSGRIPKCIGNLSAMASTNESLGKIAYYNTSRGCFYEHIEVVMKGYMIDYSSKILKFLKFVDLSGNNLSGEIPEEMTSLVGLISLNLSNNRLVGRIPDNIGAVKSLESVDLSKNNLSGEIPKSMTELYFLCYLNLSYNNLSGKIPLERQFLTFDASSFLGNKLKGPPLNNVSRKAEALTPTSTFNLEPKVNWFYLNIEFGFVFGFLGVALPILYTNSWDFCISNIWKNLHVYFIAFFTKM